MTAPATPPVVRPPKPAHLRLSWTGVFGTVAAPIEQWSFGLALPVEATVDGFTDPQIDALANGMRIAYTSTLQARMPSDVILTECRIASVSGLGRVLLRADGSYIQGINTVPAPGLDNPVPMPLQTALCVSLMTARPGPSGKGRFFLPWPSQVLDVGSKTLAAAAATVMLDVSRDFLVAVNGLTAGDVSVVSTKGYVSTVTGLRVGRAPDTMRSRRGKIPEGYVTRPLAAQ